MTHQLITTWADLDELNKAGHYTRNQDIADAESAWKRANGAKLDYIDQCEAAGEWLTVGKLTELEQAEQAAWQWLCDLRVTQQSGARVPEGFPVRMETLWV